MFAELLGGKHRIVSMIQVFFRLNLSKNLNILKYRNNCEKQICRYKLENGTLNSVLDCDSNKTITKKICPNGPKLCSAKGMALCTLFTLFEKIV